jgi:parvulin-like peptidyl-prolyl isomerase
MRVLKEPLLHFLLIGAALFAVHTLVGHDDSALPKSKEPIRITTVEAERLGSLWARQWRRIPTADDIRGILADHVKEEILVREARQLKLDEDDTVIRRRLAQKMAFLVEDIGLGEPTEAELRALYEARADISRTRARVSFVQALFKGEQAENRARIELASLAEGSDPASSGDPLLLGDAFRDEEEQSLTAMFGPSFARAVFVAESGRWSGPFRSTYGLHLVKVTAFAPSQSRPFEDVRERLKQEWRLARKEAAKRDLYVGLLRKYEIIADREVRPLLEDLFKLGAFR